MTMPSASRVARRHTTANKLRLWTHGELDAFSDGVVLEGKDGTLSVRSQNATGGWIQGHPDRLPLGGRGNPIGEARQKPKSFLPEALLSVSEASRSHVYIPVPDAAEATADKVGDYLLASAGRKALEKRLRRLGVQGDPDLEEMYLDSGNTRVVIPLQGHRTTRMAKTFTINVGDPVLFGKYKNKSGVIVGFKTGPKGDPIVLIDPVPKGKKKTKELKLFKLRYDKARAKEKKASSGIRLETGPKHAKFLAHFLLFDGDKQVGQIMSSPVKTAADPFAMSPELAEVFRNFTLKLALWMGLPQTVYLKDMHKIWKGSKELRAWFKQHVNLSSYSLFYGGRVETRGQALPEVGSKHTRRGPVQQWTTRKPTARWFAGLGTTGKPSWEGGYVLEATASAAQVIVDVDRLSVLCGHHKASFAALWEGWRKDAVQMFSGEQYEGEVLTLKIEGAVIESAWHSEARVAEHYLQGTRPIRIDRAAVTQLVGRIADRYLEGT